MSAKGPSVRHQHTPSPATILRTYRLFVSHLARTRRTVEYLGVVVAELIRPLLLSTGVNACEF